MTKQKAESRQQKPEFPKGLKEYCQFKDDERLFEDLILQYRNKNFTISNIATFFAKRIRKQAREEMLKEIPCPQMTNSSISECVCEWCKSFKEEKLGEGEKK